MVGRKTVALVLMFAVLVFGCWHQTRSEVWGKYNYQVGVEGGGSYGNIGARVSIQTIVPQKIPERSGGVVQYFWVGEHLDSGAFLQIGYAINTERMCMAGHQKGEKVTCTGGTEFLTESDARWELQYWPNAANVVVGEVSTVDLTWLIGPAGSVGNNLSWHTYAFYSQAPDRWVFEVDGKQIFSVAESASGSSQNVVAIAEKAQAMTTEGSLGPVEFKDLEYMAPGGVWWPVTSFYSYSLGSGGPYGVEVLGDNHFIAGTGLSQHRSGQLLWSQKTMSSATIVATPTTTWSLPGIWSEVADGSVNLIGEGGQTSGDLGQPYVDLTKVASGQSGQMLFFRFDLNGAIPDRPATASVEKAWYQVLFDVDSDPSTGFHWSSDFTPDYLMELQLGVDGGAFRATSLVVGYSGAGSDWSWSAVVQGTERSGSDATVSGGIGHDAFVLACRYQDISAAEGSKIRYLARSGILDDGKVYNDYIPDKGAITIALSEETANMSTTTTATSETTVQPAAALSTEILAAAVIVVAALAAAILVLRKKKAAE